MEVCNQTQVASCKAEHKEVLSRIGKLEDGIKDIAEGISHLGTCYARMDERMAVRHETYSEDKQKAIKDYTELKTGQQELKDIVQKGKFLATIGMWALAGFTSLAGYVIHLWFSTRHTFPVILSVLALNKITKG